MPQLNDPYTDLQCLASGWDRPCVRVALDVGFELVVGYLWIIFDVQGLGMVPDILLNAAL